MSLQSINDLLLQVLSEMKEMRQEINDLKRTISDMKSPIKEPLSHFHHQVASVDSRSSTTKQLPDLTVKPLTSPRKVVSKPNQHLMFEQKLDLLRQCSETVPLPPHPTNNSSLSEMVVDNVTKFIKKSLKECIFDSDLHSLTSTQFYSQLRAKNNVLLFIETVNGAFGSYHGFLPTEIMQDMIEGDSSLIIFEETLNDVEIYQPKSTQNCVCSFFGETSKNLFGVFYGYWLKCDKSYKIDSSIYEFFDNTVNAFKMNAGQYTRITAWLCE